MTDPQAPRGTIYDLGYRHYEGPRLGRRYAVRSLVTLSLRSTFGLGRGALPKVLAFGLVLLAFVPAIAQVAIAAVGRGIFEVVEYADYFGLIQVIIVLFVAAMSSELVGNDRRYHTLVLYFSRPIRRDDYVLSKITALALALLCLTLGPQLLVYLGNWLGSSRGAGWIADHASELLAIVASSVLVSAQLAAIAVAIAMFSSRRAFALTSVLAVLLVTFIAAGTLVAVLDDPGWAAAVMLLTPLFVMRAVTLVLFDAVPPVSTFSHDQDPADQIAFAGLPGWAWVAALVAQTALAVAVAVLYYRRAS